MRILVTGATGFIGSAFIRAALGQNHEIGALFNPRKTPTTRFADEKIKWFPGTLAAPPWDEISRFRHEACLHLAWIATPGEYLQSPENEQFLGWSIEFIRRIARLGVQHVIGAGTCVEYLMTDGPLAEDRTASAPTTPYTRAKNALRLAIESDARDCGYRFCWARIFYPYGPGEHPSRLCSSITDNLIRDQPVLIRTPQSTKDYIFVTDLAAAFLTILQRQFSGTINLGTGTGITVMQIAQKIGQMLHKQHLISSAEPPATDPFAFVVADASRL